MLIKYDSISEYPEMNIRVPDVIQQEREKFEVVLL